MPNLAEHLFRQAEDRPGKSALIFGGRSYTFGELRESVRRVAGGLRAMGFEAGAKVGIMLSSRPEFILLQQAAFALGGAVMPLNIHYRTGEIEYALQSCDLDYLVIEGEFVDRLPGELASRCPHLRRILVLDPQDELREGFLTAAEPVFCGAPIEGPLDMPPDALGLMLSTSATTGKAKGVMLSIANLQSNYDATPAWLGLTERDRILCALPLYNTFGLNQCINATMVTGCTLVLLPRFDVAAVLDAIGAHQPTFLPAVPTMLQKILSDPATPARDLRSIKRILVGAAPVPGPLLERIRSAMGRDVVVMNGYGLTEATAIVTILHVETGADGRLLKPRSVGQVLPGIEMMIADENMKAAGSGVIGEICIRGPNLMQGYYKQPDETANAIVNGWLRTGDLGTVDEDGHYYVVDRKKDVIIRGGQNIYPVDIEEVLYRHAAVAEAAVVAELDEDLGEVPVAYVALRPGQTADPEELRERCRLELAYYKIPRRIVILPDLPKGATGKILRRELRVPESGPRSSDRGRGSS
jgi:long-chain acyl-CoA synthetase